MSKNLLNTSTVTLDDLLSSSKIYHVPPYQRDYSWSEEHWEDLWEDIVALINNPESYHYMGSIVLQKLEDKVSSVIDGQQRFTTFSIIILTIIKRIEDLADAGQEKEQNKERVEILRRNYLDDKHATTLKYTSKLFLNKNNDEFFQNNLLQLVEPNNIRSLSASNKRLYRAYLYFSEKINTLDNLKDNGASLAALIIELISRRILFIEINVEDDLSAYIVFETLNARGVELTSTDLLKNYLFSLIDDENEIELQQRRWKRIGDTVGTDKLPDFLRYFINSKSSLVRSDRLFKTIKSRVDSAPKALALLEELEVNADIFEALKNYNSDIWKDRDGTKTLIREFSLFNVKQITPLLLSAYNNFTDEEFRKTIKLSIAISFRYSVICGRNPNELEKAYNAAAVKISKNEITRARHVFEQLKSIYVSDEEFEHDFSNKVMNNKRRKKLVRYILYKIEEHMSGINRDFELDAGTIEHIFPENSSRAWLEHFPKDSQEGFLYRLGNYCLLEANLNREIGNEVFAVKVNSYIESVYSSANQINAQTWNPDALRARQTEMSKLASHIWRSDF
ncbi:DUF262 domain-containing protein [Kangiella sp. TOML190]|uniref:DUF262 domain-containing protein n=1 Tax=Kangiella sp. TOML190 TaxID=2931351 RepID=UPI0020418FBE|nr:DUF262 domain-containing protein [Kangiella sp. TOML190]